MNTEDSKGGGTQKKEKKQALNRQARADPGRANELGDPQGFWPEDTQTQSLFAPFCACPIQ